MVDPDPIADLNTPNATFPGLLVPLAYFRGLIRSLFPNKPDVDPFQGAHLTPDKFFTIADFQWTFETLGINDNHPINGVLSPNNGPMAFIMGI